MEIPNMLNDPPFPISGDITTGGVRILRLRAVAPGDEDRENPVPSVPVSFSEKSPTPAVIKAESVHCNKKPWDAGGYSLPRVSESDFELDLYEATTSAREGATSRQSLNHRYSVSGSSFSSSVPSSTPCSHTRFSSISTTGDIYPMDPSPKVPFSESSRPDYPGSVGQCPQQLGRNEIMSPATETPMSTADNLLIQGYSRPGSPSDAIIMPKLPKRLDKPGMHETPRSTETISGFSSSLTPPDLDSNKGHKRTCSAPGPHNSNLFNQPIYATYRATRHTSRPTTPAPPFGQQTPNIFLNSHGTGSPVPRDSHMECMYEPNCNTNSTLRKAISHIFGRNKLCTRAIPEEVWVHWCRKHYQRDRYRELHEYTKRQCELVITQVRRIQDWSDSNQRNGVAAVVQDWTLSMRKRERERNSKSKRPHSDGNDGKEDDPSSCCTGSVVPPWLEEQCDRRHSTEEILKIAARIEREIVSSMAQHYPEIEILPNIPTNSVEDTKSKTQGKRNSSRSTIHKRSRSLSVTRHQEPESSHWSGQATYMPSFDTEKRQRTMHTESHEYSGYTHPREVATMVPNFHSTVRLPYRPAFGHIHRAQGSPTGEASYGREAARNSQYHMRGPLPTPIQPTLRSPRVTQLEPTTPGPSRIGHQRSISEYISRSENMPFSFQVNGPSPPVPFSAPYHEPAYTHHGSSPTNSYHIVPNQGFHLPTESGYLQPNTHRAHLIIQDLHYYCQEYLLIMASSSHESVLQYLETEGLGRMGSSFDERF
ncbi:hypothetical protein F5Y09DRAFT_357110 [Xylaria sp. FL1042]|nr:hypothetical protein F5Y09DRAFT_357110 [Xylaria sp. FL1042]